MSVRARLTVAVAVVFGLSLAVATIIGVRVLERRMVDTARASATQVLTDYVDVVNNGVATVGMVEAADTTRFFYRDGTGEEITEAEYFTAILADIEAQLGEPLPGGIGLEAVPEGDSVFVGPIFETDTVAVPVLPATEVPAFLEGSGEFVPGPIAFTFAAGPVLHGSVEPIDLGPDVVAVVQTLELLDGSELQVGVASPLRPVTDSLGATRTALWMAVPLLTLVVAGLTYLASGRALRPVVAISREAASISDSNLSRRVPHPAADDEVGHLATTVNGMLERLETARLRQRQLVADASHELRSPVAASRAQLEVSLASGEGLERSARAVLAEQERLGDMIDDLLALSRLEALEGSQAETVDLAAIVTEESQRATAHASLRVPDTLLVDGHRQQLRRLVRNILENAARHARHEVEIWLEAIGDEVVFQVTDDGTGVPEQDRERVFERFVRLDSARTTADGGSGLGLAIVREVASVHGGSARCDEAPNGGARFVVRMPRRRTGAASGS